MNCLFEINELAVQILTCSLSQPVFHTHAPLDPLIPMMKDRTVSKGTVLT
jgi:hypothetical protein